MSKNSRAKRASLRRLRGPKFKPGKLATELRQEWKQTHPRPPKREIPLGLERHIGRALQIGLPEDHENDALVSGAYFAYFAKLGAISRSAAEEAGFETPGEWATIQVQEELQAGLPEADPDATRRITLGVTIARANLSRTVLQ